LDHSIEDSALGMDPGFDPATTIDPFTGPSNSLMGSDFDLDSYNLLDGTSLDPQVLSAEPMETMADHTSMNHTLISLPETQVHTNANAHVLHELRQ
jgi:hypothetical protein